MNDLTLTRTSSVTGEEASTMISAKRFVDLERVLASAANQFRAETYEKLQTKEGMKLIEGVDVNEISFNQVQHRLCFSDDAGLRLLKGVEFSATVRVSTPPSKSS